MSTADYPKQFIDVMGVDYGYIATLTGRGGALAPDKHHGRDGSSFLYRQGERGRR